MGFVTERKVVTNKVKVKPYHKTLKTYKKKGRKTKYGYKNYANLAGVLMPNVLFTKLQYAREIETISILPNSYRSIAIGGSNLAPLGNDGAPGFFPTSQVGQQNPVTGNRLWSGINGYNKWFEKMNILSSSIAVKVWTDSTGNASTNANLQVIMNAFSFRAQNPFGAIPGLDGYATSDLMQQKNTQSRMISGSGGKNYCTIKAARTTKTMLGMVNVSDDFTTSCGLEPDLLVGNVPSPLANLNPEAQWYYYLRIDNPNPIQVDVTWSLRMLANVKLTQRTFALPSVATDQAPPTV